MLRFVVLCCVAFYCVGEGGLWIVSIRIGVWSGCTVEMDVLSSQGPKERCNILSSLCAQGSEQSSGRNDGRMAIREESPLG